MANDSERNAQVAGTVRRFLLENYLFTTDEHALSDHDSLLQKGVVDSTGMMELINFLEESFAIAIGDAEMIPENLDSVNAIVAYVAAKQTAPRRVVG